MSDEDSEHPAWFGDNILAGAAAEAVEPNEQLLHLPRLARFAVMAGNSPLHSLRHRLAADIVACRRSMNRSVARWAKSGAWTDARRVARVLDTAAARDDDPNLRALAMVVRILSLRTREVDQAATDHRLVAEALLLCARQLGDDIPLSLRAEVDQIAFGWAALPVARGGLRFAPQLAVVAATRVAADCFETTVSAALSESNETRSAPLPENATAEPAHTVVPEGHVMVGIAKSETAPRFRDLLKGHEHVLGKPVPLVRTPDLTSVRSLLVEEFPYAREATDAILADLAGREYVRLHPILLVGEPGAGKSRYVARLAGALGLPLWRTDGAHADGGSFSGTQRRWSTAEPSHPFAAISRGGVGNPVILIDEADKAPDRRDHGRLWDAILPFLEPETAQCYPDAALQLDLDLSHVNIIATANNADVFPEPLRDRFRVIRFPSAGPENLEQLASVLGRTSMQLRGLDPRFFEPLSREEAYLLRQRWTGGSIRRLRRMVEVLIRYRERATAIH